MFPATSHRVLGPLSRNNLAPRIFSRTMGPAPAFRRVLRTQYLITPKKVFGALYYCSSFCFCNGIRKGPPRYRRRDSARTLQPSMRFQLNDRSWSRRQHEWDQITSRNGLWPFVKVKCHAPSRSTTLPARIANEKGKKSKIRKIKKKVTIIRIYRSPCRISPLPAILIQSEINHTTLGHRLPTRHSSKNNLLSPMHYHLTWHACDTIVRSTQYIIKGQARVCCVVSTASVSCIWPGARRGRLDPPSAFSLFAPPSRLHGRRSSAHRRRGFVLCQYSHVHKTCRRTTFDGVPWAWRSPRGTTSTLIKARSV